MVIGVNAKPHSTPSDFGFLAQPALTRMRGLHDHKGFLGLLERASHMGGTNRGFEHKRNTDMSQGVIKVFSWKTT